MTKVTDKAFDKEPLVSCIIIFFNAEETFFREAVESIFSQTYDNWELLLVDDGSTDISTSIAQQYAKQHPDKVRYLEHEGHQNRGMSASRNLGIYSSQGQYIAFLDADDIWLPKKLERQVELLAANPQAGIVFGPTEYWFSWSGNPEDQQRDCLREIEVCPDMLYQSPALFHLLLKGQVRAPATCSVLIRRQVFEETGGFEEAFKGMFEDRVFFAKVYLKTHAFVTSECWDRYRQHSNSTCSISHASGIYSPSGTSLSHLKYLEWVEQYLSQQNLRKSEAWQLLQQSLLQYRPQRLYLHNFKNRVRHHLTKLLTIARERVNKIRAEIKEYLMLRTLSNNIVHICGAEKVDYAVDELIVLCVVRNGELYLKSFLEHYFSLGVKHIVFLDNASHDNTVAIAKAYDNVTILQTDCPYKEYETVMKKYLVHRFSKHRWNLFVDVDELFDYPFSNVVCLRSLLAYLNKNQYTAVITQMLDLFSDKPLSKLKSHREDDLKATYKYYDISNITKTDYLFDTVPDRRIRMHVGGIRKTLFNTDNGLTKAALTFIDQDIRTFVGFHHTRNARIANFTAVLLHFPFLDTFYEKVLEAVQTDRYQLSASHEYKKYWETLTREGDICFKTPTACQLDDVTSLIDGDFLVVSEDYLAWVKHAQHS